MAVIIDDMDMPNKCRDCELCRYELNNYEQPCDFWCAITGNYVDENRKPKKCPLKSTDKMIEEIQNVETGGDPWELGLKEEIIDIVHKYISI